MQAFGTKAPILANDPHDKALTVTHTVNYSQRDCISNKTVLMAIMSQKETADSLVAEEKLWVSAFKSYDSDYKHALSNSNSEAGRVRWAKTEYGNMKGVWNYFKEKLCRAQTSPNGDMQDLKIRFFEVFGDLPDPPAGPACAVAATKSDQRLESLEYPSSGSEAEECRAAAAAAPVAPPGPTDDKCDPMDDVVVVDSDDEMQDGDAKQQTVYGQVIGLIHDDDDVQDGVAKQQTVVPEFVKAALEATTDMGPLAHIPAPRKRRLRGKQVVKEGKGDVNKKGKVLAKGGFANRVVRGVFKDQPVLSADDRSKMQLELKHISTQVMEASNAIAESTTCMGAFSELAKLINDYPDVLAHAVGPHIADPTRKHCKKIAHIKMGLERNNEIYRLMDARRKQVIMVSNSTHGSANVVLSISVLLLCFVVGFTVAELTSVKRVMQELCLPDASV